MMNNLILNRKVMIKTTLKTMALAAISLTLFSCDDDDPAPVNEEETITTVEYTLTNSVNPNETVTLTSVDSDGDGPNPPVQTISGPLSVSVQYVGSVRFLNELETPAENITLEVIEEDLEHEVFYSTDIMGLTITKTDNDSQGNPLGVESSVVTGGAGSGSITIVLRHEPSKPNDGTLSGAGGETDVEVTFTNVSVQ